MVGLALIAAAAAAGPAAGHGERSCRERIEGPGTLPARSAPLFLPTAQLRRVSRQSLRFGMHKAGLDIAAGLTVTLSVAAESRHRAALAYDHRLPRKRRTRVEDGHRSVTFTACAEDEPKFSGPGVVGPRTAFSGALIATRRTCATLLVRVRGEQRARRLRVGIGRRC